MLDQIKSMIWKFDDTAYLGEILAAIADKLQAERQDCQDSTQNQKQDQVIGRLNQIIDDLCVFGEDDDWPAWDTVLDAVYEADLSQQAAIIKLAEEVVKSEDWRKNLSPLNNQGADFAQIAQELSHILAEIEVAFQPAVKKR